MIAPRFSLLACLMLGLACAASAPGQTAKTYHYKELGVKLPPDWTAKVKSRTVPAMALYNTEAAAALKADPLNTLKPVYENMPEHLEVRLDPLPQFPVKEHMFRPEITVHSADAFSRIFDPEQKVQPELQAALEKIWAIASNSAEATPGKPLPFIAFLDAEQAVTVGFKPISFKNGKGFRFITQFDIEAAFLSETRLAYVFEGLTADRKKYVLATFPIYLEGLPKEDAEEHLGVSNKNDEEFQKQIAAYRAKAAEWLTKNEDQYTPQLKTLDDIMASIEFSAK